MLLICRNIPNYIDKITYIYFGRKNSLYYPFTKKFILHIHNNKHQRLLKGKLPEISFLSRKSGKQR